MLVTTLTLLAFLIALSVPVAAVLGILGLGLDQLYSPMPLSLAMGEIVWQVSTDIILTAVPMFVLLGEILLRSGIAERTYSAISVWVSWLPGGLMHSNIGASTLFAATSGSSVATAATIGTITIPEIGKRGYNERLFLGSIAAGGTLGILIPPSIHLIIYGLLTETSVPKLYLAAFIPGVVLALIYMTTIATACAVKPGWGGERVRANWYERLRTLPSLLPPIVLFLLVVGSIYAGLSTPTEAASLGVVAAVALAAWYRRLTWPMLRDEVVPVNPGARRGHAPAE